MENQKTIIKQVGGYCVVQRSVSQGLRKHTQALGLYIFLLSLPDGWEFRKNWLKNETGLGINKLNRLLSFLEYHNLIKTTQKKIKGKFAGRLDVQLRVAVYGLDKRRHSEGFAACPMEQAANMSLAD